MEQSILLISQAKAVKGCWFCGKETMNFVPLPGSLSNSIVPFNASTSRLTTAKPKPCPLDFVVNSGVNIFALTSSGMPSPVSSNSYCCCVFFFSGYNG